MDVLCPLGNNKRTYEEGILFCAKTREKTSLSFVIYKPTNKRSVSKDENVYLSINTLTKNKEQEDMSANQYRLKTNKNKIKKF